MAFFSRIDLCAFPSVAGYMFLSSISLSMFRLLRIRYSKRRQIEELRNYDQAKTGFDVCIVGAGPAGATAAYFLGKIGYRVCLIDKKKFPRPKPCGDAWCAPALSILQEMNVLQKMEEDGIVKAVRRGGFISPFGYKCINIDGSNYGSVTGCKTYAIKRYIADEYLVKAACQWSSVSIFEEVEVTAVKFSETVPVGTWTLSTSSTVLPEIQATLLLVCDGSTSYLGQKLNLVKKASPPEAVCSHAYVKGNSHQWKEADGVMIFNKSMLPGYSALFRHYNDDMYLGTYILPGGRATSRAIAPFEVEAIDKHPYIQAAFGSDYVWEEKRVVAPIRLGGVISSYDKQVLLVGDSAGHVDPLTGEGIHTAMIAAKIATKVVDEMFCKGNFTLAAGEAYELRCYDAFVSEFKYSSIAARLIYLCPMILDAVAVVGQRRGQAFLDFFGETMTGVRPKSDFLEPGLVIDILLEFFRQFILQYILRIPPLIDTTIGVAMVDKQYYSSLSSSSTK